MKQLFKNLTQTTLSLTLLTVFTACSSDDVTEPQITQSGEKAKTSFVLSLPFGSVSTGTRVTEATAQAQATPLFRGMDNITLIPFVQSGTITSSDARLGANILLPDAGLSSLTNKGCIKYDNVSIPLGTRSFLFYGKAIDASASPDDAEWHANGTLTATVDAASPSGIGFSLKQIYSAVADNAVRNALATYVSSIAAAKISDATGKRWYDYADNDAVHDMYTEFVTLKLGSSKGVRKAVQDLYTSLYSSTEPMAVAICTAITNATYVSSATAGVLTFTDVLGSGATDYPESINLPEGAAALSWNEATPKVATANTTGASDNTGITVPLITSYVYPPSLYYRANSTLKTATTSQAAAYIDGNEWATILAGYTEGTIVKQTSKSVAITNPIQYAVGRLEATVKLGAATIYDKKGNAVTPGAGGFEVTAVLIGGQKNVDFEFKPTGATQYIIYDNVINGAPYYVTSADGGKIHTLALETVSGPTGDGGKVQVALEIENNTGADFYGKDGDLIKAGSKFYLTATLDPTTASTIADDPTLTGNRVFMQDFVTKANFTILAGTAGTTNTVGLANAYSVIPDLKVPQMELGMKVDLAWQSGITFTVGM